MRPVEQSDFPCMVRSLARDEKHIQPGLVGREFLGDFSRGLDYPQVEDFRLYDNLVVISYSLMYLVDGVFRVSRHYPVHKGAVHSTGCVEPFAEAVPELPELYVLVDAFLELLAVEEDKLAREDDEPFGFVPLEEFIPVVQELCQLARI